MVCGCGRENREGAQFCRGCGKSLVTSSGVETGAVPAAVKTGGATPSTRWLYLTLVAVIVVVAAVLVAHQLSNGTNSRGQSLSTTTSTNQGFNNTSSTIGSTPVGHGGQTQTTVIGSGSGTTSTSAPGSQTTTTIGEPGSTTTTVRATTTTTSLPVTTTTLSNSQKITAWKANIGPLLTHLGSDLSANSSRSILVADTNAIEPYFQSNPTGTYSAAYDQLFRDYESLGSDINFYCGDPPLKECPSLTTYFSTVESDLNAY